MGTPEEFVIGSPVTCSDGDCGELRRIVFNPITRELTHLVVEPTHKRRGGRLVPLRRVGSSAGTIRLECTLAEFDQLTEADEAQFLLQPGGALGYAPEHALALPYYGLATGTTDGVPDRTGRGLDGLETSGPAAISYDSVPRGETEIQRGDQVFAVDGAVGRVGGLVIDTASDHVTHVLLDEGHLWGSKQVAVPISAVTRVAEGVHTKLTKAELNDLPPVDLGS